MEERRAAHRYKLPLGVAVRRLPISKESGIAHARTRNVSTHGLYFISDQRLTVGTRLDLSLTLPAELTQGSPVVIDFRARVVRVDEKPADEVNGVGVAALIERYDVKGLEKPLSATEELLNVTGHSIRNVIATVAVPCLCIFTFGRIIRANAGNRVIQCGGFTLIVNQMGNSESSIGARPFA